MRHRAGSVTGASGQAYQSVRYNYGLYRYVKKSDIVPFPGHLSARTFADAIVATTEGPRNSAASRKGLRGEEAVVYRLQRSARELRRCAQQM